MKIRIVADTELPGGILIEAETPQDLLVLRHFCNDNRPIAIVNSGGNMMEGRYTMLIEHVEQKAKESL